MSEKLLQTLLHLFAILVREDDITTEERDKVEDFLNQQLNTRKVSHYLEFFDTKGRELLAEEISEEKERKLISDLCKTVNDELTAKQKTVLVKELIELVMADGIITSHEDELVKLMAAEIKIQEAQIEALKDYVTGQKPEDFESDNILVIVDSEMATSDIKVRSAAHEDLEGFLVFFHASDSDSYFVRYIGTNDLQLNGIPVPSGFIRIFPAGSSIRGSKMDPVYYSDVVSRYLMARDNPKITFQARNISYRFKNGNLGLRDINIAEESGKLIGLMGASGAGKSTLLNVLNGSLTPTDGDVLINDVDIYKAGSEIDGVIGYVPQDDLLIDDLTVYQNLYFAAKLCFEDLNEEQIDTLVNKTLLDLGLSETRDLKAGSPLEKTISGGQRKRLNIGLELLREPSVLFVDEPTSGLSSRDSENIMDLLKELALKGKLVFIVIHQPSSDIFKMFDKLIILDVGGYQIYYGNPVESVVYFKGVIDLINKEESECIECGNVNPEQIFNIIEIKVVDEYGQETRERKISPEQWHEKFAKTVQIPTIEPTSEKAPSSLRIPSRFKQYLVFITRDLLSKISNRQYILINILEAPLLAFILAFIIKYSAADVQSEQAYLFSKNVNIPSYLFMSVIVSLFMGLTVSAEEIFKDRKILKREAFLNLSRGSYLGAKIILLLGLSALQSFLFVLVGNSILEINGMFAVYWLVLFSCSAFANLLGLNISSAFNSAVTIYILIPILLIPQLLLSGAVVRFDKLNPIVSKESHVPLIGDIMVSRWAIEGVMVTQFKDNRYERLFYDVEKRIADASYKRLYYLPILNSKLDYAINHVKDADMADESQWKYNLGLLQNELRHELDAIGQDKFPEIDQITPERFNQDVYTKASAFLDALKNYYLARHNAANKEKEQLIAELNSTSEKAEELDRLKKSFHNEAIVAIVKNSTEPNRIVERHGQLIRKIDPVFMSPRPSNPLDFRTQLYVAEKHFAGLVLPTLTFNVIVIWLMTLVLIVTLYFDLLRKLLYGRKAGS